MAPSAKELEAALRKSLAVIQQLKSQLAESGDRALEPIAIVGMSCRFPGGADSPERYWRMLASSVDARREIPADRWPWQRFFNPDPAAPGTHYVRHGSFLDQVGDFDPDFFGISGREADALDPQHRLLLEVSWEALERAGVPAQRLRHSQTGVYVGIGQNDYAQLRMFGGQPERISPYDGTGSSFCFSAARLSYVLGVHGPSMAIDTACSSSLVALHLACQALRNGECTQALAGGVHLVLSPEVTIYLSRIQALSPDGRSKAFSADADGYGRGEGCGMLVLKRLRDAQRDGDAVLAVIRGSAVNHDGPSSGLTVPSGFAQEQLLREALGRARLSPDDVDWIEAHGTGTILGDPIELAALAAVFPKDTREGRPLFVSSVKTNIGHLEAASGIAGVIKVILALQQGALPAHLHFERPNPNVDWAETPLAVPTALTPWLAADRPRTAGVSAFGLGGTNAHVLLSEAPPAAPVRSFATGPLPLVLSAKTPAALAALRDRYVAFLEQTDAPFRSIAVTAAARRSHFTERVAVVATTAAEAAARLRGVALPAPVDAPRDPRVAFIFSGQGAQYAGMAAALHETVPAFREALAACAALIEREAGWSPLPLLVGTADDGRIDETEYTQPCLFALQQALVTMWRAWGVEPAIVLGHSIGEYAAAWTAGILSLEDAVHLVVQRGRLMQSAPGSGGMAAVLLAEPEATARVAPFGTALTVAAVNGPRAVVIAGERDALDRCLAVLAREGTPFKRLPVSHAFHSPQMQTIRAPFAAALAGVRLHAPALTFVPTGGAAAATVDVATAAYWVDQVTNPVRFADAVARMAGDRPAAVIEIGPSGSHLALARQSAGDLEASWLPSLMPGAAHAALESAARLYELGCNLQWSRVFPAPAAPVLLPTYPFERRRCWVETAVPKASGETTWRTAAGHPVAGHRLSTASTEQVYEARVAAQSPLYRDHRVGGDVVVPAAAFIEAALEVAAGHLGGSDITLERVEFHRPLLLEDDAEARLQTIVTPGDRTCAIRICSLPGGAEEGASWTEHMTCTASPYVAAGVTPLSLDAQAPVLVSTPVDDFYAASAVRGIDYGPAFRSLVSLQTHADRYGSARFTIPAAGEYRVHPVLLDAALQALAASQAESGEHTYVPAAIDRVDIVGEVPVAGRVVCRSAADSSGVALCDASLGAEAGPAVVRMQGIRMHRLAPGGLRGTPGNITWVTAWEPAAPVTDVERPSGGVVFAVAVGAVNDAVAATLTPRGRWERIASVADALALVQTLSRLPAADQPRLLFVTRGAQLVAGSLDPASAVHGALWGFGRVVRNELPQLRATCVDLDPIATDDECAAALEGECGRNDEDQVAWRQGTRYALRLRAARPSVADVSPGPVSLTCRAVGDLESLAFAPRPVPRQPGAGELRLRVRAAGLNFKDVLHALGALPMPADGGFGFDAAGIVDAVGPGVSTMFPGDRVMVTLAPGTLATTVIAREAFACPLPASMTFADGAAAPLAFLTAWHALVNVATLRSGERVLIHAAAGGVGQAAIQVARAVGAEVLATASPAKHRFLGQQGVQQVFTSRGAAFSQGVLDATGGRGVDVVLNCLTGNLIRAGFDCLVRDGRFVEIGKTGIWPAAEAAAYRPDVRYTPFDLADVARESPPVIQRMLREVAGALETGRLRPLPLHAFGAGAVADAFRLMSRARHVGKVVVTMPGAASAFDTGVHMVTGGFGALGRSLCRDLIARGARQVAIVSRRQPDAERRTWMEALSQGGVSVRAYAVDLSTREHADAALARIESDFRAPVRSIYHAAGELADGTVAQQTPDSLRRVIDAKLTTAVHLHQASRARDLDRFVLFSSAAALLGTAGQSNYAAANAGLDALAAARRAEGLPALSVNWGPWATSGMAARLAAGDRARMHAAGVVPLEEAVAWSAMHELIARGDANAVVMAADWTRVAERLGQAGVPSLLRGLQRASLAAPSVSSREAVVDTIAALDAASRRPAVARYVQERVAAVLGRADAAAIPHTRGFFALGMDSLTSLELRNRLEKDLVLPLPATVTLEYGSIESLAGYLAGVHPRWAIAVSSDGPAQAGHYDGSEAGRYDRVADSPALALADLSEAELAEMLSRELDR